MQLIFKYDIDRLLSYAADPKNKIHIADQHSCIMLSFPEVDYFNYAFMTGNAALSGDHLNNVKKYYHGKEIFRHKIIARASCQETNELLRKHKGYSHAATIAKTAIAPSTNYEVKADGLQFIKVDDNNIELFTALYLKGFDSEKKPDKRIVNNFKSLLHLKDLDLFMLKKDEKYVGVNVLYRSEQESLLAGGAILPEHRNQGFHLQSLKFRINKAVSNDPAKSIIAWAYNPSVSLKNMLKLEMKVQENFNVYEYCR